MADKDFKVKNGLIAGSNTLTVGSNPVTIYSYSNNIGIDISTPSSKLTVNAASSGASGVLVRNTTTGGNSQITLQANNSTGLSVGQISGGSGYVSLVDNQPLIFKTNNTQRMSIGASGNVGIACTSPTAPLDVTGNIKSSGSVTASSFVGNLTGNADTATTAATATTASSASSLVGTAIGYSSSAYAGNQTGVNSIPTWARRIDVLIYDVKHSEQAQIFIQLGYDGNWLQNNYNSVGGYITASGSAASAQLYQGISWAIGFYAGPSTGIVTFERWGSSNVWVAAGTWACYQYAGSGTTAGRIDLGASASSYYNVRIGHQNGFNGFTGSFVCQWS